MRWRGGVAALWVVGCAQSVYLPGSPDATTVDAAGLRVEEVTTIVTADAVEPREQGVEDDVRDASLDDTGAVATDDACGDGIAGPRETCSSCPGDLRRRAEIANDEDDDCDGEVDEGLRLTLWRLHCDDGFSCGNPALDWDHCFSADASSQQCDFAPGSRRDRCRPDTIKIILYPLSLGTASTARLGVGTLVRLKECFDARSTTHRYALDDDTPLDAGAPIEACRYLGYVPLNSWSRPGTRRVYAHSFTQASDRYYDVDPGSTPIGELMCVPETTPTGWSVWQE